MAEKDSESLLDELLVLKCRRGDVRAWRDLIKRYEQRLLYFIRRLVGRERDAWDILQQTWMGALKSLKRLDDPRMLRTWLYRIARNIAVTHLRRSGREAMNVDPNDLQELPDAAGDPNAPPEDEPWPTDAPQLLHAAMARLSVPHREVLTLHFLEDASIDEIAAITEVPPGTIKSRLYYAKRALRAEIERDRKAL